MQQWVSYFYVTLGSNFRARKDPEKTVKVEAQLTWSALWAHFNYDFQMSPQSMAQDMAAESWSREYFQRLKK